MFGIDGPELLVIIIVLIVVVGPKDLPTMMRAFGKATARMRITTREFRNQFDEAMREADMHDVVYTFSEVKKLDPRQSLTQVFDPIHSITNDAGDKVRDTATPQISSLTKQETFSLTGADTAGSAAGKDAGGAERKTKKKNTAKTGKEGSEV